MKTSKELLGARIKEIRKNRGLSQEQLAELIDVEPRHLSRIEVGKSYPTIDRLEKIARVLETPMGNFFDYMHLNDQATRGKTVEEMMKGLPEEYQQIIYRIVRVFEK